MDDDFRRKLLIEFVNAGDVTCPGCGYNLRGLTSNRCPECGEEISLRINLAEPRQGACIAGLIGLAAGVGFNGLLLLFCLVNPPPQKVLVLLLAGLAIEGLAMYAWLVKWHSIRKMASIQRVLLIVGCWVLTVGDVIAFALILR